MRALLSLVGVTAAALVAVPGASAAALSSMSDLRGISPPLQLKLARVSTVCTLAPLSLNFRMRNG